MKKFIVFAAYILIVISLTACGGNNGAKENNTSSDSQSDSSSAKKDVTKADIIGTWYEVGEYDEQQIDCYKIDFFDNDCPDRIIFYEDGTYIEERGEHDGTYVKDDYGPYTFKEDKVLIHSDTQHFGMYFRLQMHGEYLYKLYEKSDIGYILSKDPQAGIKEVEKSEQESLKKMKDKNFLGLWYEVAYIADYGLDNQTISHDIDEVKFEKKLRTYEFDKKGYVRIRRDGHDDKKEYMLIDNMLQISSTTHYEVIEKGEYLYLLEYDYDRGVIKPCTHCIVLARDANARLD